jgi:hypothetical protein
MKRSPLFTFNQGTKIIVADADAFPLDNAGGRKQIRQCDQIGRIFAYWAVFTLASFFNNNNNITELAQIFGSFFKVKVMY